jgi:hypothetical protein
MSETAIAGTSPASVEEIQQGWPDLNSRVRQLEAERNALEQENKDLRFLLERFIENRSKSHSELVLLLTSLVSKLPINDVGIVVSKLVEHNANVCESLAALVKGTVEADMAQPAVLKTLDQSKQDLLAALKPIVEELIQSEPPLDSGMLRSLIAQPDLFFSPQVVRANRGFVKGSLPRERIVKDFGQEALAFFNDLTTDPKRNPSPKPEEIVLGFKNDFEALFKQNGGLLPDKRDPLMDLYRRVQRSKGATDHARSQRNAFLRMSIVLELLYYYEHQNTEAPDVIFAQRLPSLVEQLVVPGPQDSLDEKLVALAEGLLAFIIRTDHRQMVINNIGKNGGVAKTLKFALKLRAEKTLRSETHEIITEFVRHLIPAAPQPPPTPEALAAILRLVSPEMQPLVARGIMDCDRMRKDEAQALGRAVGARLGLTGLEAQIQAAEILPPDVERRMAWGQIKDLIAQRADATAVAAAIRDRLTAKYDAEEIKASWITLTEADPISLIRIFCQVPYRSDGRTDSIARPIMESYVTRLTHEKYAAAYQKVVNSLRNMFKARPDSPTLLNFMALVRWVDSEAAQKLSADIGMPP